MREEGRDERGEGESETRRDERGTEERDEKDEKDKGVKE